MLGLDSGIGVDKVNQGSTVGMDNSSLKAKMQQSSLMREEKSLHYSYWMDTSETEQLKNRVNQKMQPIFNTLFPVVFPLEKLN